jgi:hypothetical protein
MHEQCGGKHLAKTFSPKMKPTSDCAHLLASGKIEDPTLGNGGNVQAVRVFMKGRKVANGRNEQDV